MGLWLSIGLVALSFAGAFCYLLVKRKALDGSVWLRFTFLLTCPVAGALFLLLGEALYRLVFRRIVHDATLDYKPTGVTFAYAPPDEDTELNVVSIEEAMLVSHKSDLRRLLLSILKDGADNSLDAIALALDSEDSEAAHYSASAIADSLARYYERVRVLTEQYELSHNPDTLRDLVEYVLWYLSKSVLSEHEQVMYLKKTAQWVSELEALAPAEAVSSFYLDVTALAIRFGALDIAREWADRIAERFPDTMDTYTANLHCRFALNDDVGFRRWLDALKHSKVVVNKETLDLIHTFG